MQITKTMEEAWAYLIKAGMTDAGAAGMMGNLYAESGIIPDRVEILCLNRLAEHQRYYTDKSYTQFVDNNTISREEFLHPLPGKQYGYGLAQWTSPGRKAGLYDLCKSRKKSIGDLETQLEFLISELRGSYPSVWNVVTTTNDILQASNIVLAKFEAPADTSSGVQYTRYSYGKAIYDALHGMKAEKKENGVKAETIINIMREWIGYSEYNGKYRLIVDLYNTYCASHGGYPRGYRVPYGVAWCDVTVSAAFAKAGAVDLIGGLECGVEEHIKIFKNKGIWIEDGSILPQVGDIITYNWDSGYQPNNGYADHIGLIEAVNGSTFTVIEGNYNDQVARRVIPRGWGYIRGFARPRYSTETPKPAAAPAATPAKPAPASGQLSSPGKLVTKQESSGNISFTPKWVGRVTANALNVRTWAGTEYPNIKSYPILGYSNLIDVCDNVKAKNGATWYFIRIAGKIFGFVHSAYIERA